MKPGSGSQLSRGGWARLDDVRVQLLGKYRDADDPVQGCRHTVPRGWDDTCWWVSVDGSGETRLAPPEALRPEPSDPPSCSDPAPAPPAPDEGRVEAARRAAAAAVACDEEGDMGHKAIALYLCAAEELLHAAGDAENASRRVAFLYVQRAQRLAADASGIELPRRRPPPPPEEPAEPASPLSPLTPGADTVAFRQITAAPEPATDRVRVTIVAADTELEPAKVVAAVAGVLDVPRTEVSVLSSEAVDGPLPPQTAVVLRVPRGRGSECADKLPGAEADLHVTAADTVDEAEGEPTGPAPLQLADLSPATAPLLQGLFSADSAPRLLWAQRVSQLRQQPTEGGDESAQLGAASRVAVLTADAFYLARGDRVTRCVATALITDVAVAADGWVTLAVKGQHAIAVRPDPPPPLSPSDAGLKLCELLSGMAGGPPPAALPLPRALPLSGLQLRRQRGWRQGPIIPIRLHRIGGPPRAVPAEVLARCADIAERARMLPADDAAGRDAALAEILGEIRGKPASPTLSLTASPLLSPLATVSSLSPGGGGAGGKT